jgi:hypothetical protein
MIAPEPNANPRPRGGRRSRQKGNRAERAIVAFLQESGFAAERVPLSGSAGGKYIGDVTIPLVGRDMCAEVKVRAHGFGQLYAWLDGREILIVRQDRREPLVILPLRLAAEIAGCAERSSREMCTIVEKLDDAHRCELAQKPGGQRGLKTPPRGRQGAIGSVVGYDSERSRVIW